MNKILKIAGVCFTAGGIVLRSDAVLNDNIKNSNRNNDEKLVLLKEGAHLREGNHRVVITDQFYKLLTSDEKMPEKIVNVTIDAFKEAYDTLNKYNTGIQFELYTTNKELAEKYNVDYIDYFSNKDIPIYLTEKDINNDSNVAAALNWKFNDEKREMINLDIVFKYDTVLTFRNGDTLEETLTTKNSYTYSITLHETMHGMGFAHQDTKDTVMYPYTSFDTPKDLTDRDIKMLEKYNEVFYSKKQNNSTDEINETETIVL